MGNHKTHNLWPVGGTVKFPNFIVLTVNLAWFWAPRGANIYTLRNLLQYT